MGSDKCHVCLRYIGAADQCPFCDADAEDARLLKWLRLGALLVAVYGVIWMIRSAQQQELPLRSVSALRSAAFPQPVRIEGEVTGDFNAQDGSFLVGDATGSIRIYASRDVARALVRRGGMPTVGQRVSITAAIISNGSGTPALRLQTANGLILHPHFHPERETSN